MTSVYNNGIALNLFSIGSVGIRGNEVIHKFDSGQIMFNLIADSAKCTGCRACEIACSYHHGKLFSFRLASLRIQRVEREGKISILLYEDLTKKERGKRFPCDLCADEPVPMCVKYCVPGAITVA